MFVNKHVLDVIVVVVISSVCYVDHLLCHNFSGSNPSGFSAKRKVEKLAKIKKEENVIETEAKTTTKRKDKGKRLSNQTLDNLYYHWERKIL